MMFDCVESEGGDGGDGGDLPVDDGGSSHSLTIIILERVVLLLE